MLSKKTLQFFALIGIIGILLFLQINEAKITGFSIYNNAPGEERLPDLAVVWTEKTDNKLLIDYYPGKYIGRETPMLAVFSIMDSGGNVLYKGEEEVDLNVNRKHRFIIEIDLISELPENYEVGLELVEIETPYELNQNENSEEDNRVEVAPEAPDITPEEKPDETEPSEEASLLDLP